MTEISDELSPLVVSQVAKIFPNPISADVARLLMDECGKSTLYRKMDWSDLTERVQCAVLKLSEGDVDKLNVAIELYKENWKQLLHKADFGLDENAHRIWANNPLR